MKNLHALVQMHSLREYLSTIKNAIEKNKYKKPR